MWSRPLAVAVAIAILASACGSDTSSSEALVTDAEPASSPLVERLGFSSDEQARQRQLVVLQAEAEAGVARCMELRGFRYTASALDQALISPDAAADGTRDWAEQNGLGITRSFIGARNAIERQRGGVSTDPDLAALTEEQRRDYLTALVGSVPDPSGGSVTYEPGGCLADGFEALAGLRVVDEFSDELASLNRRLAADPRVVALDERWSLCMHEAGHDYADPEAMADDIYARLLDIDAFVDDSAPWDPLAVDVHALLTAEQRVAVAAFDCGAGFRGELAALRADYEREFIEDHRDRIDRLAPGA